MREVAAVVQETVVGLGAEDCYWAVVGAFTGEVSTAMLGST
ncbi:MAG: triose-phosphate isomerase [Candidatus Dormibacter sp.]